MNALYECSVSHRRLKPRRHRFTYRVFMLSVDVDQLPALGRKLRGFSHNRFDLYSIDDRDHVDMGEPGGIRPNLTAWMAQHRIRCPDDARIRLITFPRVLGYGFNPVSFYYVESADGAPIITIAEVVNTFREMKLYAVPGGRARLPKDFYVSPFSDPGDEFDFRLGPPAESWRVNIDDCSKEGKVLVSSVCGERRELASLRLLWYAFKYPFLSLKIITLIHWHALLIWMKRVPFFRKSDRIEAQRGVMRSRPPLQKPLQ